MEEKPLHERARELEERTARFGEAVIGFAKKAQASFVIRPLLNQLIRSATSVGANYCEADDSESMKDFRHKIAICRKEAREAKHWLRMVVAADDSLRDEAAVLWKEAKELNLIFSAIIRKTVDSDLVPCLFFLGPRPQFGPRLSELGPVPSVPSMNILGIETSCDETCAAVVTDGRRVLSNVVATQVEVHRKFGGVVPEIASRATSRPCCRWSPRPWSRRPEPGQGSAAAIDAVAVVYRPGLIGSLLLGLTAAKTLAWLRGVPLIGVNHVEGHIYAACLERDRLPFPCISLIVSGGHTSLYHSEGPLEHTLLGATTDDAAGEAFDKVAALLELPYPGGPSVDRAAERGSPDAVPFTRPWLSRDSIDFSFSGLKTAVLYHVRGHGSDVKRRPMALTEQGVADTAASFQECVVEVLVTKTLRAAEMRGAERVIVGGGVAANRRLRARFQEEADRLGIEILLPQMRFCTDNAAMIAGLGYHLFQAGRTSGLDLEAKAV